MSLEHKRNDLEKPKETLVDALKGYQEEFHRIYTILSEYFVPK